MAISEEDPAASMNPLVMPPTLGNLLKYEAPNLYSRKLVTVQGGLSLRMGTVLARAPDGKYSPAIPGGDGTPPPEAVLIQDVDASDVEAQGVAVVRHAIVARNALLWGGEPNPQSVAYAVRQLEERGIVVADSA